MWSHLSVLGLPSLQWPKNALFLPIKPCDGTGIWTRDLHCKQTVHVTPTLGVMPRRHRGDPSAYAEKKTHWRHIDSLYCGYIVMATAHVVRIYDDTKYGGSCEGFDRSRERRVWHTGHNVIDRAFLYLNTLTGHKQWTTITINTESVPNK